MHTQHGKVQFIVRMPPSRRARRFSAPARILIILNYRKLKNPKQIDFDFARGRGGGRGQSMTAS